MKSLLLSALLLLSFSSAQAQVVSTATPTLGDHMKAMKASLDAISKATQLTSVADEAVIFREHILAAMPLVPTKMASNANLTADQLRREQLKYQRELADLIPLSLDLEEALLDADSARLQATLQSISAVKSGGHPLFK